MVASISSDIFEQYRYGCLTGCLTSPSFRLRNDLYCVEWGVKLYSLTHQSVPMNSFFCDFAYNNYYDYTEL